MQTVVCYALYHFDSIKNGGGALFTYNHAMIMVQYNRSEKDEVLTLSTSADLICVGCHTIVTFGIFLLVSCRVCVVVIVEHVSVNLEPASSCRLV